MRMTKKLPGWNFQADDEGGIYFSNTGHLQEPPEELTAYRIGSIGVVVPDTAPVTAAKMEYIGRAYFGEPRGSESGSSKWTGDYLTFSVYAYPRYENVAGEVAVIVRQDGLGTRVYLVDQLEAGKTFRALCSTLAPELLWDVLNTLVHTYDRGVSAGEGRIGRLFLEDRLKKKRRGGKVSLEIKPPKPKEAAQAAA